MMLAPHFHFHPAPQHAVVTGPGTGPVAATAMDQHQHQQPPVLRPRKRRAEDKPENNERLSKRMSLLNLEQSGAKLYVPVESLPPPSSLSPTSYRLPAPNASSPSSPGADEMMALDDTKYKVYIRNLDDELTSSEDESDTHQDNNNLIINLPDIQKHLRDNRIPPAVLRAPPDLDKQLVLYRVPSSLTVPEEQDSVRKAILEARARLRGEKQPAPAALAQVEEVDMDADDEEGDVVCGPTPAVEEDPDAMELD
ncbi:hypothetical protein QBC39DRAFT_4730 [Podospora conica]|nr:hypothetical protein QBC39DRAFT_4730 [Schizothecium conicum]